MRPISLFFFLAFASLVFSQNASEQISVEVGIPPVKQVSENEVDFNLLISNKLPSSHGVLKVIFNERMDLEGKEGEWNCMQSGVESGLKQFTCSKPFEVLAKQPISLRFKLLATFEFDKITVFYEVPAFNATAGKLLGFTYAGEPSKVYLAPILFFLASLVLWLLTYFLFTTAFTNALINKLKTFSKNSLLFFSIVVNFFLALTSSLLVSPTPTLLSVLVISIVFAVGYLALNYLIHLKKTSKPEEKPTTLEELEAQKKNLEESLKIAKIRFMKKEIDEKTFASIVSNCELEIVKIESRISQLKSQQPSQAA